MNSMQLLLAHYSTLPGVQPKVVANPGGGVTPANGDNGSSGRVFLDIPVATSKSYRSPSNLSYLIFFVVYIFF